MLMLDRYKVSCLEENKKNFTDECGEIFFVYAYNSLAEDLKISKRNGITKAIHELETLGLVRSKKVHGKATMYYLTSNPKDTTTSNPKDTLIIINNKNNINKNNTNNNNKENVVAGVIRQEIHFLIKSRNIKIDNVLKYCSNLDRIKEVFSYADKNNKADGWIIACLKDNYKLEATKEKHKKNYDLTFDDI
nr:MAG TPA: replication initiator protein [Caudoviricetes sp.]